MARGAPSVEQPQRPVSRPRTPRRPRLSLVLGMVLASGPLAIAVTGDTPPELRLPLLTQVVVTAILGLMLVGEFFRGVPSLVRTFSLVFGYVSFGIGGAYQLANGLTPWFKQLSPESYLMAQLVMVVGFGSYWFVSGRLASQRAQEPNSSSASPRIVSTRRVGYLLLAYLAIMPVLLPRVGGVDALFATSRATASQLVIGASEAERNLAVAPFKLVPVVALSALLLTRRHNEGGKSNWLLICLAGALTLVANWPPSIARFWLATVVLMIVIAAVPLRRTGRIALASSATVAGLFIFPVLARFRSDQSSPAPTGVNSWATGDYDTLYTTALGVEWVQRLGHTLGEQAAGTLLFFVPRAVWLDKPIDTGVMVARDSGFGFTNLSSPLWVEGYVDFGLVGAAAVGGLLGLSVRYLAGRTDDAAALVGAFLVGYQLIVLRGPLLQAVGELVFAIMLSAVVTERSPVVSNASVQPARNHRLRLPLAVPTPPGEPTR